MEQSEKDEDTCEEKRLFLGSIRAWRSGEESHGREGEKTSLMALKWTKNIAKLYASTNSKFVD